MEVIAFGTFIEFYRFCAKRFGDKQMTNDYYLLQKVRSMRNACAHNNCVLNSLASGTSKYSVPNELSRAVSLVEGIGKDSRKSRLSNDRLQEIAATLYMHVKVASDGVHAHRTLELANFKSRMEEHSDYYSGNLQIKSSF